MDANKHDVKVAIATLILVGFALSLSMLTQVMSAIQANTKISNQGTLKTVGVGVYWDSALTNKVSSIDWGILEPSSNVNKTVYIRNEGNAAATLSMTTSNWSPANASTYLTLTWNYGGQTLNVNEAIQVKLSLAVSSSIAGITNFSFDITIAATSQ
jgi:hypothetical protein